MINAVRAALADADLSPADVGHIHAHGLAAREADIIEASAIVEVFGETAGQVPVTAMKSALGNSGAGCGTLELAASLLALGHGVVPRTLNFEQPDAECPLDVVHGELPCRLQQRFAQPQRHHQRSSQRHRRSGLGNRPIRRRGRSTVPGLGGQDHASTSWRSVSSVSWLRQEIADARCVCCRDELPRRPKALEAASRENVQSNVCIKSAADSPNAAWTWVNRHSARC